jgi:hypothetical protein
MGKTTMIEQLLPVIAQQDNKRIVLQAAFSKPDKQISNRCIGESDLAIVE